MSFQALPKKFDFVSFLWEFALKLCEHHLAKERSLRVLNEPHLGKEKPVMGNIEPLLGITKPAERLNKPCQGNVNGRKSFAAERFNVKIPFVSQTYTKAVAT